MPGYPETRRSDVLETLHGVDVADPYRWLEDADSPEVADWVSRQRTFTEDALAALPGRSWFGDVMRRIVARPRAGVPIVRGGRFFVSRNDGTQAQDVWFMADTLDDLLAGGVPVLDPNAWSADGTASLSTFAVSPDGRLLVYGVSEGGSDWQRFRVKDLTTLTDLPGQDVVGKFSVPRWLPDNASFLYSTFDEATDARGTATTGLGAARLMVHRLGDGGSEGSDELVLTFPDEPRLMAFGDVSHDGRWLVVSIVRGTENVNRVWAYPLHDAQGRTAVGEPIRVVDDEVAEFGFVRTDGDRLFLATDLHAPRGRLVSVDLDWAGRGDVEFAEVLPETTATLTGVEPFGDDFLAAYLHDAQTVVAHVRHDGVLLSELDLPPGALVGLDGAPDRSSAFVGISTLDAPTASFRVEAPATEEQSAGVEPLHGGSSSAEAPAYTVTRCRAVSRDGTQVPYFLVQVQGQDAGPRPTLLYGYGGFKVPVLADYRPGWSAWLKAGGVLAIANLRGGGEFGTAWYEAGRGTAKQNVFDDVVAVAEHLIETGVTAPEHLALHGRSNGGLLVGAAMTQRPDLFAAALPTVGVLDLLRFHRFTIGAAWISDYGDPDEPDDFAVALAYSPLHNVRDGVRYPATLVSTADHDDRVVPLHSFKFGAALQRAQAGDAPVLLRIESSAGHGAGKALQRVAEEWADLLAFAAHHTGLEPPLAVDDTAEVAG